MKKLSYILGAALVTMGSFTSCDIDDVENYTETSTENFPVTPADATAVLAGIYENLNETHAYPQQSFYYYSELASDDQLGGGGVNDKLMQAEDLLTNYNADMTNDFWKARYAGINRANTLIAAIPNLTALSDEEKTQYMGEALTLRAFYHYELASMYGNVPLMTVPSGETVTPGDVKVLWGQILQDLYTAATTMKAQRLTNGHIDKYVAEALLGRVWLFYTGFYGNGTSIADLTSTTYNPLTEVALPDGTTLTKKMVADLIDDCVNNSGYSLVSDYRNLWAYTNKYTAKDYKYVNAPVVGKAKDGVTDSITGYKAKDGIKWVEDDNAINPEAMFAIKFNKLADWATTIGYANGVALHFGVRGGQAYENTFPFGQGWGAGPVAPNLVDDWKSAEPNDPRLEASVQDVRNLPNYTFGGWADFVQETNFYEKKLSPVSAKNDGSQGDDFSVEKKPYFATFENLMYGVTGWPQNADNMQLNNIHDLVLVRFADVLLMQSELKEDVSGINKVRARAGLPAIAAYSLKALQNERRFELAFEGTRWNDIRRWHIAAAALERQTNQPVYYEGKPDKNKPHNGGYAARFNATAGFAKIPDSQVSVGSAPQNDGYATSDGEYTGW
ncbi:MAG: RagB/SusD family nutrient uptake outer membrane protein [Prevotella sp.]|nr:RagB/SusD family nutrient uptake outer membrane protein [Prevotella sp.]